MPTAAYSTLPHGAHQWHELGELLCVYVVT
jgi:hypothetical protein